jgi:hypothetical protein
MGGTETYDALMSVFNDIKLGDSEYSSKNPVNVLMITDGSIWNTEKVIEASKNSNHRIFTICVGSAANDNLVSELAEKTGGAAEMVAPNENIEQNTITQFQQLRGIENPVGTVQDYKSRRVLVYSPTTGQAVVCQPAYYLWGDNSVGVLKTSAVDEFGNAAGIVYTDVNKDGSHDNSFQRNDLALERKEFLSALVSPDAAYFLGMLNLTAFEREWWENGDHSKNDGSWHGAEDAFQEPTKAGIAPFPIPRRCLYAFVPDDTPLGVVPDVFLPAQEFARPNDLNVAFKPEKIIGFGRFDGNQSIINPEFTDGTDPYQFTFNKTTSNYGAPIEITGTS